MKVFETIAVGVGAIAVGLFVGMCTPESKKPKFCADVTSNIGERLRKAETKVRETVAKVETKVKDHLNEREEKKEPKEAVI